MSFSNFTALAHHHAAKSINTKSQKHKPNNKNSRKLTERDSFIFDENSIESDLSPTTLKFVHLKESLASHEEAQRLQRMCRELKNKEMITRVLKEAQYKSMAETEILQMNHKNDKSIDEDYDLIEAPITACSKFTLSLTGPDFTMYKIEDPFKKLGPIAIFSARRHWTAPRGVRLQKGTSKVGGGYRSRSPTCHCRTKCSVDGQCDVCSKYSTYTEESNSSRDECGAESFGFHVRGDAPVIISYVEHNSLADVSVFVGKK